ncbi:MAG: gfo/Idh/MocA family oxidoreductase [Ruminococcaceae bacterium]|nr:gfo/Idh/MocA family oxidoreductase [Oscillospiraceae bacterium]
MKDVVRIAFVGLSGRGYGLMDLMLTTMDDVKITAVCDLYEDRTEKARARVEEVTGVSPFASCDYKEVVIREDVDAVITPSSWTSHVDVCVAAMKAGKYAATEVGGAPSIEDCWMLVRTSEETGMPCMMLENCCYGREEMMVSRMVHGGLFGELVHCKGAYAHDLRDEICMGRENRHYRIHNFSNRAGDLYPTHALGPIAKMLGINNGNRFVSLVSMQTKSVGLNLWAKEHRGEDDDLATRRFAAGDVVTTMIRCAHGETIVLTHDDCLPRPYSRGCLVQGTRGLWSEDKNAIMLEGRNSHDGWDHHNWESMENYFKEYEHPLWNEFMNDGVRGGHGGMDYLVLRAYVEAVKKGEEPPITVYDTAAWMSITTLSEDSCNMGSMPVAVPDFTRGKWIYPKKAPRGKYSLDEVCDEAF